MTDRDDRLDGLLARGRMAGASRERVLEAVLRDGHAPRPWYARRFFAIASPALAGAAVVAIVFAVRSPGNDMRPKGSEATGGPHVSLECTRGSGGVCSREGMLLFRVEGLAERAYLAAYAQPRGGGERTWFFPAQPDSFEPLVEPGAAPQVLRQGVKLTSVPEGTYEVRIVLGSHPVSADRALAGSDAGLAVEILTLLVGP